MLPKVSVIIPVYNIAQYLPDCLQSVTNQLYSNLEIIVVNDGSTDESTQIINCFAASDSRIVHLKKENGGLPSARKAGMAASTGDFVIHLDGDDFLPKDVINLLVNTQQDTDADMVFGNFFEARPSGTKEIKINLNGLDTRNISGPQYLRKVVISKENKLGYIWGRLFRRGMLADIRYQDLNLEEDIFMIFQIALHCKKIVHIPNATYYYRRNEQSITSMDAVKFQNAHIDHCLAMCDLLPSLTLLPRDIFEKRMVWHLRSIAYYFCICKVGAHTDRLEKLRELYRKTIGLYPSVFIQNLFSANIVYFAYVALTLRMPFLASIAYSVSSSRRGKQ